MTWLTARSTMCQRRSDSSSPAPLVPSFRGHAACRTRARRRGEAGSAIHRAALTAASAGRLVQVGCVERLANGTIHTAGIAEAVLGPACLAMAGSQWRRCCCQVPQHTPQGPTVFARDLMRERIEAFNRAGGGSVTVRKAGCGHSLAGEHTGRQSPGSSRLRTRQGASALVERPMLERLGTARHRNHVARRSPRLHRIRADVPDQHLTGDNQSRDEIVCKMELKQPPFDRTRTSC